MRLRLEKRTRAQQRREERQARRQHLELEKENCLPDKEQEIEEPVEKIQRTSSRNEASSLDRVSVPSLNDDSSSRLQTVDEESCEEERVERIEVKTNFL